MAYAVNLADLMEVKRRDPIALLLFTDVRTDEAIEIEAGRFDGMGMPLNCDDDRSKAIVDIVRMHYKKHQLRLYHSVTGNGGWKRV